MQTIALCMIVKNEAHVITRALDSVKNFVDCFYICDTGSTDGTQALVTNYLKEHNLSGKVYQHKWKNFSHNRNKAFKLAYKKADYIMTLDADEKIFPYVNGSAIKGGRVTGVPEFSKDMIFVMFLNKMDRGLKILTNIKGMLFYLKELY